MLTIVLFLKFRFPPGKFTSTVFYTQIAVASLNYVMRCKARHASFALKIASIHFAIDVMRLFQYVFLTCRRNSSQFVIAC